MIIAELTRSILLENASPYYPFVYTATPTVYEYPSFWTDTFGFPGDSDNTVIIISSVKHLYVNNYSSVNSVSACISQEKSFYFDNVNQKLYVHVEHIQSNFLASDIYQYGRVYGYTNKGIIYIDDIEYLPYLQSVPSIAQQEDLQNYDRLSLITGSSVFNNVGGNFNIFKDENIYGNDINYFYLDDDLTEFTRSDLIQLASVFVDDYQFSLKEFEVFLQDKRAAQNIDIPSSLFSDDDYPLIDPDLIGEPIPLIYGTPRVSTAYPIDGEGTGDVTFRNALILIALGTIQVKSGDSWITVTPSSYDLSIGSFTLSYSDCRDGGTTIGGVLECRVLDTVGISNTYSSDVIKDLNERELGITYNTSNYDISEWEIEEKFLEPIAIVFDTPMKLFDAIRLIQNGSNIGFRYEPNSSGLRTIRIYSETRDIVKYIQNVEIFNIEELPITSNKDLLAAIIKVNYAKDFNSGKFKKYIYDDRKSEVEQRYRQAPTLSVETYLTSEDTAIERAVFDFNRFSIIPRIALIELKGAEFLNLRIYDIITIELTPGFYNADTGELTGLEYFGVWNAIIISIDPDFNDIGNNIKSLLISEFIPSVLFVADHDKPVRKFITGTSIDVTFVTHN